MRMNDSMKSGQYAVIFTSKRSNGDDVGYSIMAESMERIVSTQPGYLGHTSVRSPDGTGITVSYWDCIESIKKWKSEPQHQLAQEQGKASWYSEYEIIICKIERSYGSKAKT